MKRKVVIVSGIVYPNPSPPGKITLQYANMLKIEYDVSIICMQTTGPKLNGAVIDGISYFTVSGVRFWLENYFIKRNHFLLVSLMKAIGRLQRLFNLHGNLKWFYCKSYKRLIDIHNQKGVDYVFSICMPFQSHLAGIKFKSKFPHIKHVTYTVDSFVKGNNFVGYRLSKALALEKSVYINADYNLVSEEIYNFEFNKLESLKSRFVSIPYLLENLQEKGYKPFFDKDKINLVYAGNFYKEIRNPEIMLNTLLKVCDNRIRLHLFSGGECEDIVESYVKKSDGRFIKYPQVAHKDMISILNDADIMINVSNNVKEFQPSKTFEYISLGKPIVNFYVDGHKDELLAKFPVSLQFSNQDSNLNLIKEFILSNHGVQIKFSEIEKLFNRHGYLSVQNILLTGFGSSNNTV